MNDRELLELAALAAGIELNFPQDYGGADFLSPTNVDGWKIWNPLIDDGDALRLEVAVNMTTKHRFLEILAEENANCSGDYIKARRRAITRYAAEIGKAMQ